MPHHVIHFEIAGPDGEQLTGFYRDLFEWDLQAAGPDYWLVPSQGEGIGGGLMRTPDGIAPYVTIYVSTDDLQASLDRAVALGGTAVVPPTEISGTGVFAMFRDPAGNLVSLLEEVAAPDA